MMLRELPPTAGLEPCWADFRRPPLSAPGINRAVAAFLGKPDSLLTCSGTAALVIAFEYLKGRSARRTVIVPGYTCPLVVLAAERAGLRIAVCDTVAGGLDLDRASLSALLDGEALCVVATHYGGYLTDVPALRSFIAETSPETFVIEDAAQAFGAQACGRMAGTAGHIGVFSFAAGKGFTLYEGGCLVGETAEIMAGLRKTARRIAPPQRLFELRRSLELCAYYALYNPFGLYLSYGLPRRFHLRRGNVVKAVGDDFSPPLPVHAVSSWRQSLGQNALRRLPDHLVETRRMFKTVSGRISEAGASLDVHRPRQGREPVGTFVFVTFPAKAACAAALRRLWRSGLGVSKLFACSLAEYPYLADRGLPATPNAADFAERTLTVTTSSMMRDDELDRICAVMASVRRA